MKGDSPVTHKRQAELEIEQYLESRLADVEGALLVVLLRQVRESETLLAESYDRPLVALARVTEHLLSPTPGCDASSPRSMGSGDGSTPNGRISSRRGRHRAPVTPTPWSRSAPRSPICSASYAPPKPPKRRSRLNSQGARLRVSDGGRQATRYQISAR